MFTIRGLLLSCFIGLTAFYGVLLTGLAGTYVYNLILSQEKTLHEKMISSLSQNFLYFYDETAQNIKILALDSHPQDKLDSTKMHALLDFYLKTQTKISSIHFYSPTGELLLHSKQSALKAYTPTKHWDLQQDQSFARLAKDCLLKKTWAISPPYYSRKGYFYQVLLIPVFSAKTNEPLGVFSAAAFAELTTMSTLLKGFKVEENNFVFVTDGHNNIMASDGVSREKLSPLLKKGHPLEIALTTSSDFTETIANESYYFLQVPIAKTSMKIVLGIAKSKLQMEAQKVVQNLYGIITLGFVLSVIIATFIAKKITYPLNLLQYQIKRLSQGHLGEEIEINFKNEVGETIKNLNSLSRQLKKDQTLGHLWQDSKK